MSNAGIDYGMGRSNINRDTGIRYGVIGCNSVMPDALAEFEGNYGEPSCPKCGNRVVEYATVDDSMLASGAPPSEDWEQYGHGCADYACEQCEHTLDSQDVYGEEPTEFTYDRDGYSCTMGTDGFGVFVLESPFYTLCRFCSPCAPGAGDLDNPLDDGAKTYCLGHDWFDGGKAPYPVFRVSDNKMIDAESES